jgi:hypothetical protein
MSQVKIRIYRGKGFEDKELVRTIYVETNSEKSLTRKRAGQILANNFSDFDNSSTRNGLSKNEEGFYAMRTIKPTEKCSYHYVWEYAILTEENFE